MTVKKKIRIQVFDGTKLLFERCVPQHRLSDRRLEQTLKRLVSKAGLTFDEIIDASISGHKQNPPRTNGLDVKRDNSKYLLTCGDNPHVVAELVEEPRHAN